MSDFIISLIPTDPRWQPDTAAAADAAAFVRRAFADPDGMLEVSVEFHDRITAIDAGENLERIACPRCGGDVPLDWYGDLLEEAEGAFDSLDTVVPCCGAVIGLDTLRYHWPCGFARFEIAVLNPTRAHYEFTPTEQQVVADLLGHPVRQVVAHI